MEALANTILSTLGGVIVVIIVVLLINRFSSH